ncbi:tripartite tricarboxylate transporter substrate binding protein [Ferrovibrio terrae]|uniref:Bug family tripartite tricarboxylate transporter substrate binding protein n=1 Tax=Ferrovibrio terrae TaxID=2594003 RepID=UPI003137A0B0
MKTSLRGLAAAIVTCAVALLLAPTAWAQAYPGKIIKLVVPFAAGSGTDAVARITAQNLTDALGQQVIVDNKPGANGAIAAEFVARSAPDGYTLFMTTNTTHSANPSLMKKINYDPVKDFAPVSRMGNLPFMLVVNPELPIKSVKDLIDYARKNPGKVSYGTGNSTGIVAGATFGLANKIELLHVSYKSTPPAMTDVMGGQVTMMFTDLASGIGNVKAGRMRALAVTTAKRSALVPDLPSMEEAGVPNFDLNSWNGVFAPAGTPADIIARLNAELVKIVARPEVKDKLAQIGFDAFTSTPAELDAFVRSELVKWAKLVKDAGIEAE